MELKELFSHMDVEICGDTSQVITGISSNSKNIQPGYLFIAKSGRTHRGEDYISEAAARKASAILTTQYHPAFKNITQVLTPHPEDLEALVAAKYYGFPSKSLHVVAITGTNGKTSCSYLIRHLMGEKRCGLIGTIEYLLKDQQIDATLTTPDVVSNQQLFFQMQKSGLHSVVMEATSVALTQNRLDLTEIDIALFTNFSQDHLDYHKSMEAYLLAKASLFERLSENKLAILNIDDPAYSAMLKKCKAMIKTYGQDAKADYRIENVKLEQDGTLFTLTFDENKYDLHSPLIGEYNVYNLVAAIAIAIESGISWDLIFKRLQTVQSPQGRLQKIESKTGGQIFVDFAHTEDALKKVLITLKQIPHRKLITVFGCGGDRDAQKRPLMGKIVSNLSDVTIITSDNPRNENPQKICEEILKGCDKNQKMIIQVDRKKAIELGIQYVQEKDILLIAGRGHEKFQIIAGQSIPFSDAHVVKEILDLHSLTSKIPVQR